LVFYGRHYFDDFVEGDDRDEVDKEPPLDILNSDLLPINHINHVLLILLYREKGHNEIDQKERVKHIIRDTPLLLGFVGRVVLDKGYAEGDYQADKSE
jgi:hypothetical protein